jgi:beta-glucosidase-like glycosyl hydrolase
MCSHYAAIKHFVANDQESERTAADSVLSDRALREVYLYPLVASYCSEHEIPHLYPASC